MGVIIAPPRVRWTACSRRTVSSGDPAFGVSPLLRTPPSQGSNLEMGEPTRSSESGTLPPIDPDGRYHALDAMRASMMLLGIVLHAACSYTTFDLGTAWPYWDPARSMTADIVLGVIHPFRMPAFFLVAGFFGALLAERKGLRAFALNRTRRIAVPLALSYLIILPTVLFAFDYSEARLSGGDAFTIALTETLRSPYENQLGHLWFLYYLLYFYAAAWLSVRFVPSQTKARLHANFRHLLGRKWLPLVVSAPLAGLCLTMPGGILETTTSFTPSPAALAGYSTFFAFGWLLHGARERLDVFQEGLRWRIGLGLAVLFLHLGFSIQTTDLIAAGEVVLRPDVIGCALTGALAAWMLTFAVLGSFLRFAASASPAFRYASDASYWVYLVHLTFAALLPSLFQWLPVVAELRLVAVVVLDTLICFGTYALFVRTTVIGQLLSGRIYRVGVPRAAANAPA